MQGIRRTLTENVRPACLYHLHHEWLWSGRGNLYKQRWLSKGTHWTLILFTLMWPDNITDLFVRPLWVRNLDLGCFRDSPGHMEHQQLTFEFMQRQVSRSLGDRQFVSWPNIMFFDSLLLFEQPNQYHFDNQLPSIVPFGSHTHDGTRGRSNENNTLVCQHFRKLGIFT